MCGSDYQSKPDESVSDHAHRIVLSNLMVAVTAAGMESANLATSAGQAVGSYMSGFEEMKSALISLYKCRENLHRMFKWTEKASGEWVSQLITSEDHDQMAVIRDANLSFKRFVKSWQPVMDSIAEMVCLVLQWKGLLPTGGEVTMRKLAKAASRSDWLGDLPDLKSALTDSVKWYTDDIRIMRNQFVHNQREVMLTPAPASEQTIVEVVRLDEDKTRDRFPLDQFVNWTVGHFLLLAVAVADGVKAVCRV